jgi:hypothetical protein
VTTVTALTPSETDTPTGTGGAPIGVRRSHAVRAHRSTGSDRFAVRVVTRSVDCAADSPLRRAHGPGERRTPGTTTSAAWSFEGTATAFAAIGDLRPSFGVHRSNVGEQVFTPLTRNRYRPNGRSLIRDVSKRSEAGDAANRPDEPDRGRRRSVAELYRTGEPAVTGRVDTRVNEDAPRRQSPIRVPDSWYDGSRRSRPIPGGDDRPLRDGERSRREMHPRHFRVN